MGSVIASNNLGKPPSKPAKNGSIPNAVSKKNINTPKAPGSKLFIRWPAPKAAFWSVGTLSLGLILAVDIILVFGKY
jgi:hypothetical protein